MAAAKHPGFKKVATSIAKKQGISMERAGAILASSNFPLFLGYLVFLLAQRFNHLFSKGLKR